MFWIGIIFGLAAYLGFLGTKMAFRVEEGYVAVLTRFGAAVTDDTGGSLKIFEPGIHFKWPWEKKISLSMKEQNLDLSGEEGGRAAMAADGTVLRFDSVLRFLPLRSELAHWLFDLRAPLEHITGLFTCLLRNEIANVRSPSDSGQPQLVSSPQTSLVVSLNATESEGGSYGLIRRERVSLNNRIEEFCRTKIEQRYGIQFRAVDLKDILPPDELARALNAVKNAQAEAEAAYAHAQADCQQRILAAERALDITKANAKAAELEIDVLAGVLRELDEKDTLESYISRRKAEVQGHSRTLFMRS